MKVLIVEDNKIALMGMKKILSEYPNIEICAAETGWGTEDGICDLHPFQKREEYRGVVAGERVGANQHIENRE